MERNTLFIILGLSVAAVGAGYLLFIRKEDDQENKALIDEWSTAMLASELSRKLSLSKSEIHSAFENGRNSAVSRQIDDHVINVSLKFTKISSNEIEAQLNLIYKDDTDYSAKRLFSWLDTPEIIRRDFLRSNSKTIVREWEFPWKTV